MANVDTYLQQIMSAVYGEEVRGSIHDAIEAMNVESTNAEAVAISSRNSAMHYAEQAEEHMEAAEAAQTAAEAAQTASEAAQAAAETAQNLAETAQTAAEAAQTASEDARDDTLDYKNDAYSSKNAAQLAESHATDAQIASQNAQRLSEAAQAAAEAAQAAAEAAQAAAEAAQAAAERILSDLGYPMDPRGKCTFANLPEIANVRRGWMYQITNSFTPDNRFVEEDRGIFKPANTEVYLTADRLWACLDGAGVSGVKGNSEEEYRVGQVNITKANIGLSNVDNTSDADKPISTAQQAALDLKANDADLAGVAKSGSYNDLRNIPPGLIDKAFEFSPVAPTNTKIFWIDSGNNNALKFYDGTSWIPVPALWS